MAVYLKQIAQQLIKGETTEGHNLFYGKLLISIENV